MTRLKSLALPVILAATLLTACNGRESYSGPAEADYAAEGLYDSAYNEAAPAPEPSMAKPGSAPVDQSGDNPSAQSFLAYRYNYAFALPSKTVAKTAESHAEACRAAGPDLCQVLSSSTYSQSETHVSASLQLRAEPDWLDGFTGRILKSVEDADGDLTNKSVSAEDLTRQILDTDARLNAQKTLRDRLETLLETQNADLKDLLALEREFARVQGEIESATTTLNVLRKRVSMSVVDLNYQSQSVAVSRSAFAPIGRALKGFAGTASHSLAAVIDFVAAVIPWLILLIPGFFLVRWIWRRRKAR